MSSSSKPTIMAKTIIVAGYVMISGVIKGTPFDQGHSPAIEGSTVAAKYWELYTARKDLRTTLK
jgi:hypothetical protein